MGLALLTAPAEEPVSLAEAKDHLRVDLEDEDSLIDTLILAARQYVEESTSRSLITQTWQLKLDCFPDYTYSPYAYPEWGDAIRLFRAPVQSVTFVKYLDTSGVEQTLASTEYVVDVTKVPAEITLAYGKSWPAIRYQRNAITVQFIAGYGDSAANVPAPIKQAMLLRIGELYENREAQVVGQTFNTNPAVEALLGPYRYPVFA